MQFQDHQHQSDRRLVEEKNKKSKCFQHSKPMEIGLGLQRSTGKDDDSQTLSILESFIFQKLEYQSYRQVNVDANIDLHDYSTVTNEDFKQKFLDVLDNHIQRQHWNQIFIDDNVVTFTRQLTQAMNKLTYFNIQYDQWTYYHQLGLTQRIWYGRMKKRMATANSVCVSYGRTKESIEQHRSYFQDEIVKCMKDVETCEKETPFIIDLFELQPLIHKFVDQDQYRLRLEFERQRHMLIWDAQDHQLVKSFYQLNPSKTDVTSARRIWRATNGEQLLRYELNVFRKWISLPTATRSMCVFIEFNLTTMKEIFSNILTTKALNRTASPFQNPNNSVDQLVAECIQETVDLMEESIQAYANIAHEELQKMVSKENKLKKSPNHTNIVQAIYVRQENIIRRAQYYVEQSIKMIC